jgi:ribosomal protein S18 acetylase RimI-like enzyme
LAAITLEQLRTLSPADLTALSDVLIDCADGGASVGFMNPLPRAKADAFWREVVAHAALGERVLLVARGGHGRIVGTVQLVFMQKDNQPHRAEISKLLVHRAARHDGLGARLMQAAEQCARDAKRSLLVLDTATGGGAEGLYERLGWQVVGRVPDYALWPDGGLCSTTIFYKSL